MRPLTNREKRNQEWLAWCRKIRRKHNLPPDRMAWLRGDAPKGKPGYWLGRPVWQVRISRNYYEMQEMVER